MAIEAEALLALSEKASQGEWSLGKAEGGYRYLDAAGIPSKPGPDRNMKWSGFARFVVEMEDDATCSGRSNLEFVAALVNEYRAGSLIHHSALAEDTARAAEGWRPIETAPKDGTNVVAIGPQPSCDDYTVEVRETHWMFYGEGSMAHAACARGEGPSGSWYWSEPIHNWGSSWQPTHWMPLPIAPTPSQGNDEGAR